MTTRAELRTRIRAELNDAGVTPLWPDERLNQWIVEGLRDLGRRLGLEKSVTLMSVQDQASYALPADLVQVRRVEHPSGLYRTPVAFAAGDAAPEANGLHLVDCLGGPTLPELRYDVWGGTLELDPVPGTTGEPIVVRYLGAYAEPTGDGGPLDVPSRDEDAVLFFVCGRSMQWIAGDEAKRQRFERQRGADPIDARREYDREYTALVRQRRGRVAIRRLAIRQ
jgi:hypothetical protein